jgi:hypothetical protein
MCVDTETSNLSARHNARSSEHTTPYVSTSLQTDTTLYQLDLQHLLLLLLEVDSYIIIVVTMNNPPQQHLAPPPLSLPPSFSASAAGPFMGAAMLDDAAEYETASIASNSTVSTIMTTSEVADDIAVAEFEFEHPDTVVLKCFKNHYESSYYLGHHGGGIHPVTAHILIENLPFTDPTHELQETTPPRNTIHDSNFTLHLIVYYYLEM